MPDEPRKPTYGGSCLPGFAEYLKKSLSKQGTLDGVAGQNNQYVLVHLYLVPGGVTKRLKLREAIEAELRKMQAVKLHDLAFAVPANRTDERNVAEQAWNRLICAGADDEDKTKPGREESGTDAWEDGDVVYIHYVGYDGICVLAGAPRAGKRLPQALEIR